MKLLLRPAASVASAFMVSWAIVGWAEGAMRPVDDAAARPALDPAWINAIEWRCIGPANMGGRITDIAVNESDPTNYWVATASGGLLRTANNGITFEHQFDREATVSLGAVAVARSNPDIVWVGTGEANPRNSVSYGDGVYKSIDGGRTWKNMGLARTFQIGRVVIHPTNPDVVYVGAMGRCWGDNEDRGLYKTTDGGATWRKILYIDDATGVIDIAMNPSNPDALLVATWERRRDAFDGNDPEKKWGPGSGLYKTTDGGDTFRKITVGLPSSALGRIGLDYSRGNPNIVYAVVDCEKIGSAWADEPFLGVGGEDADPGSRLTRIVDESPAARAGLKIGDVVVAADGQPVASQQALLDAIRVRRPGDTMKLSVSRDGEPVEIDAVIGRRPDSDGKPYSAYLGGQRENIQAEQGPQGHEFGGVYRSEDGGETWARVNSLNPRPMYFSVIRVDPSDDQLVYVLGVQLHWSKDGGRTFANDAGRGVHADQHAMWIDPANGRHLLLGNDGGLYASYDRGATWDHLNHVAIGQFYHVAVDTRAAYSVYGGLQDNGSWGGPARVRSGPGPVNTDWIRVGGGDGFVCAVDPEDPNQVYYSSQNGATGWRNLASGRGGAIRPPREEGVRHRFNWRTPYILSAHNPRMYYIASNYVMRSYKGGQELRRISPEITRTDRGSATALAESPLDPGVIYVGTDDGALWGTRDGGHTWTNLFDPPPPSEADQPPPGPIARAGTGDAGGSSGSAPGSAPRAAGSRFADMIRRADADGDGIIRRAEMPPRMVFLFDRIDADKSGSLESAEIDAFIAQAGRRAGGESGGADPASAGASAPPSEPHDQEASRPGEPPRFAGADDPVSGRWMGRLVGDVPRGVGGFELTLRLTESGKVTGDISSDAYSGAIPEGSFDAPGARLRFSFTTDRGPVVFSAKVDGRKMAGELSFAGGALALAFEAERADAPAAAAGPGSTRGAAGSSVESARALRDLVPGPRWVASIEASRYEPGRVYLCLDGHRSDNDAPYLFASEDYGRTWRPIAAGLPAGSTRVLREDIVKRDMLYCGTEFAAYVSLDRGGDWTRLNGNLPTVAVHEFAQHPKTGEIIAATHGRSLWVADVTPLRQLTPESLAAPSYLYKPAPATIWRAEPSRGVSGARHFIGQSPSANAAIYYSLAAEAKDVALKVTTLDGQVVRTLTARGTSPGLHRVAWDLRRDPPQRGRGGTPGAQPDPARDAAPPRPTRRAPAEQEIETPDPAPPAASPANDPRPSPPGSPAAARAEPAPGTGPGGGPIQGPPGGFGGGRFGGQRVEPGTYVILLTVDGREHRQSITVNADPDFPEFLAEEEEATEDGHREPRQPDAEPAR